MPEIYSAPSSASQPQNKKPDSIRLEAEIQKEILNIKNSFLSGFVAYPQSTSFETQEEKEKIILLLRQHFITNIHWILMVILMLFAPLILSVIPLIDFLPARFQFMTVLIWYLFTLAYFLESSLSWYFNVYIVTDERVIDTDFYSLIYKHVSETKIDRIEDVTYIQGGFIQSMFNYGIVKIQTAGEIPELAFENVPQPAKIAKILNQLILQEEQEMLEGSRVQPMR